MSWSNELMPFVAEVCKGIPSYPLYKHLASSLFESIHSGALCTACKERIPAHKDQCLNKNDEEWNKLIVEKGSALLSVRLKSLCWNYYFFWDDCRSYFGQVLKLRSYRYWKEWTLSFTFRSLSFLSSMVCVPWFGISCFVFFVGIIFFLSGYGDVFF